jgi:Hydantoinase/oxoprolinase N-terminal region/AMP-binding enzyme
LSLIPDRSIDREMEVLVFQIGVDIGGTFTDCVLVGHPATDGTATYRTAKALSTKSDPADGVLTELADGMGLALPELLARTERFGHGTTIGTNAVLERTGARVGVITTAGHGDALAIHLMLADPGMGTADLSALRTVCFGGAPVAEAFLTEAAGRLPGVSFANVWGLTEATSIVTCALGQEWLERPWWSGGLCPGWRWPWPSTSRSWTPTRTR